MHLIVKVRTGGSTGISQSPYHLPSFYMLALFYVDLFQVCIAGDISETMINQDLIPITKGIVPCHLNYPVARNVHG